MHYTVTYFSEIYKYLSVHEEPKRRYQKISKFFNISKLLAIRIITKETSFSDLKAYLNQDTDHSVNILRYALVGNSNLKYNVLFQNWLFKRTNKQKNNHPPLILVWKHEAIPTLNPLQHLVSLSFGGVVSAVFFKCCFESIMELPVACECFQLLLLLGLK